MGARKQTSSLRMVGAFDPCTMSVVFNEILSILNVFYFVLLYVSVSPEWRMYMPRGQKRMPDPHRAGVADNCKPPSGCWESNFFLLEEQPML